MPVFNRVVEKGLNDGAYQIGLFNWIEPFLVTNLNEYAAAVKQYGLRCEVASTLSLRVIDNLIECLKSVDMLWITTSGFSQEIYEINHVGGHVEYMISHSKEIAQAKREGRIQTDILLRFLRFDYNEHEQEQVRDLALHLGFRFEVLIGSGHPMRKRVPADRGREIYDALGHFSSSRKHEPPGSICPLLFEHIAVNADGDVYQCSAHGYHEPLRIGPYLELSREEILLRRYNQPFCNSCSWKRRAASDKEKLLLKQALDARLGLPIVDRVPHMSGPNVTSEIAEDGSILPKDGHVPSWFQRGTAAN